jgi:hypothetical protein
MSHVVAHTPFEQSTLPLPHIELERIQARPALTCCQQAVEDALENAASMGTIATAAMLIVGFVVGLTTAWVLFG